MARRQRARTWRSGRAPRARATRQWLQSRTTPGRRRSEDWPLLLSRKWLQSGEGARIDPLARGPFYAQACAFCSGRRGVRDSGASVGSSCERTSVPGVQVSPPAHGS
eukprot:7376023-Alexandrium_andersonii.AAC.1